MLSFAEQARLLERGGIGVLPTDTLYGILAGAGNREAVSRLYRLRRKTPQKPFIVLISSIGELGNFGIAPSSFEKKVLKKVWPGKVSVVFPCKRKDLEYLHLGTQSLAFRLPKSRKLTALLKKTGPLLAPSANPEGQPPATTITEAKRYFGTAVDFYVSAGKKMAGKPSTLISFENGKVTILREGAVAFKD